MKVVHTPSTTLFAVFVTGLSTEVTENKDIVFEVPTDPLLSIPSVEDETTTFITIANGEVIAFLGIFASVTSSTRGDAANEDRSMERSSIGLHACER